MLLLIFALPGISGAQGRHIQWHRDGNAYFQIDSGQLVRYDLPSQVRTIVLSKEALTPPGRTTPLAVSDYRFSPDDRQVLLFTNAQRVWRYPTRGDYWLYDLGRKTLKQLGKGRPAASLMFAKLSPDGKKAAYVSQYNLYVEDLATGAVRALTTGGHRKWINGTFDWAYEEEFFARDGFRWSPDSRQIAYWQIDARKVKDYLMINHTDSIYPSVVPVEYPVAGEPPSPFKIGVVDVATAHNRWMELPYDPVLGDYAPRMEWAPSGGELVVQHLNRKQNRSRIFLCTAATGKSKVIYEENDSAWIDVIGAWDNGYQNGGWDWINGGKEFVWASEKDGWRHLYRVSRDGRQEKLITAGA
ncbi:MAG TPA: DPP IV N-terminal domain-containing protein, partial [Chitinophagaceae bacterium]|nr:DPP IV N-terminal domain-containing protein [Chitinophagaceae bacterium]